LRTNIDIEHCLAGINTDIDFIVVLRIHELSFLRRNYSGQQKGLQAGGDTGLYSVSGKGINGLPSKAFWIASKALTAFLRAVEI